MSDATYSKIDNFDFYYPQPNLDSELVRQLGFIPGLQEFLTLRQVHALEHATVWVLSNIDYFNSNRDRHDHSSQDNETIGGLSTDKGFYLYGEVNPLQLKRAVHLALNRLTLGEWNLALHPRCGTNASVAMFLTAGMAITAHCLLPRTPIEQLVGLGIATSIAVHLAPEVGMSVQKYITTAIPFNLKIQEIVKTVDMWNRPAHFVRLKWHNSQ
jgi:hypothetical protein